MEAQKLPFKLWTIINNIVASKLGCSDLYRFFVLLLTTDKELKTDTTLEQLASFIGEKDTAYKGGKATKSFTDRLRESGEVKLRLFSSKSYKTGKEVSRLEYTFNPPIPTQYRRIHKSLIDLPISNKLKGYIIKLFSVCEPYSNLIKISQNKMVQQINMSKKTIKDYNAKLEALGLLEQVEEKFLRLKVDCLIIDEPKPLTNENKEFLEDLESFIESQQEQCFPLGRREQIYLKAKNNGFKDIRNMDGWVSWLKYKAFVTPKKEDKKETSFDIIL